MEVSISVEELRKRKLFIATPMYGGMCGDSTQRVLLILLCYVLSMEWSVSSFTYSTSH